MQTLVDSTARYGSIKFTTDRDGNPLPRATLLRLGKLAVDVRFRGGAIEAIMAAFVRGISDFDAAAAFYRDLSPVLLDHPCARPARAKALPLLTAKIESLDHQQGPQREIQLLLARNALAHCLGPVNQMFTAEVGVRKQGGEPVFKKYSVLPLRSDIKQLSYPAFFHLLSSDELCVKSENEAYLLAACWATQSDYRHNFGHMPSEIFHRLVGHIRWQHLTPDFVANTVAHCPFLRKAGGPSLASVVTAALVHREAPPEFVNNAAGVRIAAPNRARNLWDPSYTIRTGIQLEEVNWLATPDAALYKIIGQVDGYPLELSLKRVAGGNGGEDRLELHVCPLFPRSLYLGPDAPEPQRAVTNGLGRGVALDVTLDVTGWRAPSHVELFCPEGSTYAWRYAIPLSEAAQGSAYFPNGRCEIELQVVRV